MKYFARHVLINIGVSQVITMDLHHMQMQGFFDVPVDNVRSSPLMIHYIKEFIPDYTRAVVVAKNAGASKR
jgi:ribose-phosphate pyrophosphokinase